jgi:predicted porin
MKKIAKISLVAAIAVAGFTTANAQPLEEAIKNVDVSGSVVYRYNDTNIKDSTAGTQQNFYKVGLNLASKVNDDVKFNSRFVVNNAFAGSDTSTGGDGDVNTQLSQAYFGYTGLKNTTVNVGKQGLTTPWTVAIDSDSNEQTGTGILALSTVGPVTFAGAYFNQTNLGSSAAGFGATNASNADDIATAGIIADLKPVTLDGWYLDKTESFNTYTLGAKASADIASVNLGLNVRYTSLDLDTSDLDNNMVYAILTAKAGIIDAKYAFAKTDKEGGTVALDNDAVTTTQGWNVRADTEADSTYHQFVLGAQVLAPLHLSANYVTKEYDSAVGADTQDKETEIYAQAVYKMSKNLSTYVRYGVQEDKDGTTNTKTETENKGRLQVEYTF